MTQQTAEDCTSTINNLRNQLHIARSEINNLRQQLRAAASANQKEYESVREMLDNWRCLSCSSNQPFQDEASALPNSRSDTQFPYIGVITTNFPEKRGTPRQPGICPNVIAKITLNNEIFTNPGHALEGLQEYSHMWVMFHFHKNDSTHLRAKVSPPRLNGIKTGVFATRSPHRPSPIGLSLVKIDRIMDNTIYFSGVDMIDQTPVLDIKPYIPQYDNPTCLNSGFSEIQPNERSWSTELSSAVSERTVSLSEVDSSNDLDNSNVRIMDGEENRSRTVSFSDREAGSRAFSSVTGTPPFSSMSDSRIGEREAPDGEEEEDPRPVQVGTSSQNVDTVTENIRVPAWIAQPPVSTLRVFFKDRALAQLQQLGPEGEEKKNTITNVLREDPRSVYLRERWGSHCYVFRIAELYVSCKFNQGDHSVTVYQIFENSVPDGNE